MECRGSCGGARMVRTFRLEAPLGWRWDCSVCHAWCHLADDGTLVVADWQPLGADDGPDPDLFAEHLTPPRVRFWLQHWLELKTIEDDYASSRGLSLDLAREWSLLQARRHDLSRPLRERLAACLCQEMLDQGLGASDLALPVPGRLGDSRAALRGLVADLERAADGLPTPWRATRKVFAQQQRSADWRLRFQRWRSGAARREVDATPEAPGSYGLAVRLMAQHLTRGSGPACSRVA